MQIPPELMRFATIENRDPDMYVISGLKVAADFSSILHKHGTSISKVQSILDIGCGVGRVSRVLPLLCNGNIYACDVVKEFIDWCSSNIENVSFFNNNEYPPLEEMEDESIDFIYALSVFTHLDEVHQNLWLEELQRICKPGGTLLLSFRSKEWLLKRNPTLLESPKVTNELDNNGISFVITDKHREYFKSFYQGAYHSRSYIKNIWGKHFDVIDIIDTGKISIIQDLAVLRKK